MHQQWWDTIALGCKCYFIEFIILKSNANIFEECYFWSVFKLTTLAFSAMFKGYYQ